VTMIHLDEDAVLVMPPPAVDPRWAEVAVIDDGYVVDWQIDAEDGGSMEPPPADPGW
jgi:hypothetical protein